MNFAVLAFPFGMPTVSVCNVALKSSFANIGKTTLLDGISGRKTGKGVQGTITMNGAACGQMFHRISAYVPQVSKPRILGHAASINPCIPLC